MLSDLPAVGEASEKIQLPQPTWPRVQQTQASWVEALNVERSDFVVEKPGAVYNALVPNGTLLNWISGSYSEFQQHECNSGLNRECFAYLLFAPSHQESWVLTRTAVVNGATEVIVGFDPTLSAALSRAIPSDLRLFAATIGLESYLATAPNEIVTILKKCGIQVAPDGIVFELRKALYAGAYFPYGRWCGARVFVESHDLRSLANFILSLPGNGKSAANWNRGPSSIP